MISGQLHAAVANALKDEALARRMAVLGIQLTPSTPEELDALLEKESKRLGAIVRAVGASVD